jgi:hypothetical protein
MINNGSSVESILFLIILIVLLIKVPNQLVKKSGETMYQ